MLVPNSVFFLHKARKQGKREGVKVATRQKETESVGKRKGRWWNWGRMFYLLSRVLMRKKCSKYIS